MISIDGQLTPFQFHLKDIGCLHQFTSRDFVKHKIKPDSLFRRCIFMQAGPYLLLQVNLSVHACVC